ncbi:transposase [Streptomyces sp. TRM66268-LWL]|uniref:Transposase n=1 Tax=Streptomyces polyasparticus TaxID=2767826 RepID=A0ABR7SVR9_9ACTN|nr:transposase [Streptomyces polyasparticus]MBC9719493.1 transposase [Streptomyces polyasparticus]
MEQSQRPCSGARCAVRAHRRRLDQPPKAVLDACPELRQTHDLVRDFAHMLAHRAGVDLSDWIRTAPATKVPGITGFGYGLTTDLDAVIAGLTVRWSSGGTEGAANRVKEIRRQLYDAPDSNSSAR